MNENRISLKISEADSSAINQSVQTLTDTFQPLLIALTSSDKAAISKMKDKSVPFVEKVLQYTETNPEFIPAYLNVEEMKIDYKAFNFLNNILRSLDQIVRNMNDTAVLSGSEAYNAARVYYDTVKKAATLNVPGAKAIYEDLKIRFEGQGASKNKPKLSK